MKFKFKYIISIYMVLLLTGCTDYFLDLNDPSRPTDESYFTKPEHFREAANYLYTRLPSYRSSTLGDELFDYGSDLSTTPNTETQYAYGNYSTPETDKYWNGGYVNLRSVNNLLKNVDTYPGDITEVAQEIAEAKFFRAWFHFQLVERFGGVPIVIRALETDSEELYAPRNSRYEVVEQIFKDLDEAIADLPLEANVPSNYKGLVTQGAAKSFKARVLLNEATWMKYNGTSKDGNGTSSGAGSEGYNESNVDLYFAEAIELTESVMADGSYELWNYNDQLENLSSFFLFNLSNGESNPAGLDKTTIKEFIFSAKHDIELFHSGTPSQVGRNAPSRKMMDMILCADGLPIEKSSQFQGYVNAGDEYLNRDYRMKAYFGSYYHYGDANVLETGVPTNENVQLLGFNTSDAGSGYKCQKYERWGEGNPEFDLGQNGGMDRPLIRLAEVYLIYAEALCELNGSLSDDQLDASINKTRQRAGLPPLTNAFIGTHNLNILEEVRRERAVEFYAEKNRFLDLCRWGIAVEELTKPVTGMIVEGTAFEDDPERYRKGDYPNGTLTVQTPNGQELEAVHLAPQSTRNFETKFYLFPIPSGQILLNNNLKQNPGY